MVQELTRSGRRPIGSVFEVNLAVEFRPGTPLRHQLEHAPQMLSLLRSESYVNGVAYRPHRQS